MRRKLKIEVERQKILLAITLNSTLVLTEIMKKKKEEEKGDMGKRLVKTKRGKGGIQQH